MGPADTNQPPRTLEVRGVGVAFHGVAALADVDLDVARGEILGLIGPNGAGKSTLVNVITGYQVPDVGSVVLGGAQVTGWAPHRICRTGLGRTFQGVRLFGRLTVAENVEIGVLASGVGRRRARRAVDVLMEEHGLTAVAGREARGLPYGDQRRLALARALGTEPDFLLVDEPAAGLDERETEQMTETLARVRDERGCGLLVIEHDMGLIMRLCDRIQVLNGGRTICVGIPSEVRAHPAVLEAYLGAEPDAAAARASGEAALRAIESQEDHVPRH